jgi:MprA protease rhombosortase-interaction domain-containing protein
MKHSILKYSFKITAILVLLLSVNSVYAQDDLETAPEDVEDTPVDGGVLLLLAGGAAYGLYRRRNEEETN